LYKQHTHSRSSVQHSKIAHSKQAPYRNPVNNMVAVNEYSHFKSVTSR